MKYQVVGNQKMIAVCEVSTAVLTAVSGNFLNHTKMFKTPGTAHWDMTLKNKVEGSQEMVGLCKVPTAVLTAVSANFVDIQECFFGL